jgi:DNA (cytosine-5)-methyltransferase 1
MQKTFYEFFAGIGLVHLGLKPGGWECLWANDIDEAKREIYELNFENITFSLKDIWKVRSLELPGQAFLATASFPCTDLSVAGARKGLKGEQSGTFFAFSKIIKGLKRKKKIPPLVMVENVVGLLTANEGRDVGIVLCELASLGYSLDLIELNAIHFIPQSRARVFIFGINKEISASLLVPKDDRIALSQWKAIVAGQHDLRTDNVLRTIERNSDLPWAAFQLPSLPKRQNNLNEIIEEIPVSSELWWTEERKKKTFFQMSKRNIDKLRQMMNSDKYSYGTIYRRIRAEGSMAELRNDGVAGCLRTPRGGSSKQIILKAGRGEFFVRWMTPREYARLQGVPDSYILPNDITKSIFGLGDAVCVPAISWIDENILTPCYKTWLNLKH